MRWRFARLRGHVREPRTEGCGRASYLSSLRARVFDAKLACHVRHRTHLQSGPHVKSTPHMSAHVLFLQKSYKAGNFLVSGRKVRVMAESFSPSARAGNTSRPSSRKIRSSPAASPIFASSNSARASAPTIFRSASTSDRANSVAGRSVKPAVSRKPHGARRPKRRPGPGRLTSRRRTKQCDGVWLPQLSRIGHERLPFYSISS